MSFDTVDTNEGENRKYKEWKEKFFSEILPQLITRRVFTFSDQIDKSKYHLLSRWFGETISHDVISIVSNNFISLFQYQKVYFIINRDYLKFIKVFFLFLSTMQFKFISTLK